MRPHERFAQKFVIIGTKSDKEYAGTNFVKKYSSFAESKTAEYKTNIMMKKIFKPPSYR